MGSLFSEIIQFDFYGDSIRLRIEVPAIPQTDLTSISAQSVKCLSDAFEATSYNALVTDLLNYREKYNLDDWLYYQLIRKTVEQVSPKAETTSDTQSINGFCCRSQATEPR